MTAPTMTEELDMMGRKVDPLAHIKRGDDVTREQMRAARNDPCGQHYHPLGNCARAYGHPVHWQHIAVDDSYVGSGPVLATWMDDKALDVSDAPAELEGEETPLLDIKPGAMCRFRNRRDLLMILGRTQRGSDTVEALNLTRQRFCRLKIDRLVERKPTDADPTQEQMAWVAEFLADRKHAIGQVGQREVDTRRWSRAEMVQSLAKADLTPPPLKWTGRIDMGITFELPPGVDRPTDRQLRDLVKDALHADGMNIGHLSSEGITLKEITHVGGSSFLAS